ncbi:TPA: glycosyltransferase [Streptococcus suis]|nr:glycosyltransferase [Streptococcus suis]
MVKTAVLMATYNGSQFIEKQLDSIRKQTLAPDYVLMRDDCSTDDTVEVVKNYIQKYNLSGWSIQRNASNLGWRLNFRQLMLDVVSYDVDYIFFSDQDDIWYLDKNERQVTVMEERQDIDLLSADADLEVLNDKADAPEWPEFVNSKTDRVSKYPKVFKYVSYRPGFVMCLRKSFSDLVVRNMDANIGTTHDNLFSGIAGFIEKGYNLNQSVAIHKRHGENASGHLLTFRSPNSEHIKVLSNMYSYYSTFNNVLLDLGNNFSDSSAKYVAFYRRRLENAQKRNLMGTVLQMLTEFKFYENFPNYVKDLVFLFKK